MARHLLLDSHAFLWSVANPEQLSMASRLAIKDASNFLHVSAASLWELLLKASKGKLNLGVTPSQKLQSFLDHLGATVLPVRFNHLTEAYLLPGIHREPFDRLLIGQARVENMLLVTTAFMKLVNQIFWSDATQAASVISTCQHQPVRFTENQSVHLPP